MKNNLELELVSAEWTFDQSFRLLEEYKKCNTEYAKGKVEKKLRSMWQKLNYESANIDKILKDFNENGNEV